MIDWVILLALAIGISSSWYMVSKMDFKKGRRGFWIFRISVYTYYSWGYFSDYISL